MKGLKALGKYVDLKRMSTVGVSYGCTSDLLVRLKPWQPGQHAGERAYLGEGAQDPQDSPSSPSLVQKQACNSRFTVRCSAWLAIAPARPAEHLHQAPHEAPFQQPGSHLSSVLPLTDCSVSQCPRPRLSDPGPEGCARAAGLLQRLQLPDEPARGSALPPHHPGGHLQSLQLWWLPLHWG